MATKCSARVSPGSAPSTKNGPVCGLTKRRSTFSVERSLVDRSAPLNASSDHNRSAVPGVIRRSGATPPNVNAYCSNVGTTSTTSMPHPRNPPVPAAMGRGGTPRSPRSAPEPYPLGGQFRDGRDAEQLHRAGPLAGQDVRRPLPAPPAPRHEPVQVRPADQAGAGAACHGGDDVGAVQDAAVQVHLGPVADGGDD